MEEIEEKWRPIAEFPNENYEVSNFGNVRNKAKKTVLCKSERGGYLFSTMSINGEGVRRPIHQLVAEAFIPNPENKLQVNHKDKVRNNNFVNNLEWCTQSENCQHRSAGVKQTSNQTLKTQQIDLESGKCLREFDSILEAATWCFENGFAKTTLSAQSCISNCTRGVTGKACEFFWKIKKGDDLEGEEWRNVILNGETIEDYFVSNLGRFKNTKGVIMENYKPHASGDVFVRVNKEKYPLHHLVAFAFVPNPENKPNVVHINGNDLDFKAENLKWSTAKETCIENRLSGKNQGFKRAVAVYDLEMNELKRFKTMKEVSTEYNVSYSCVKDTLSGKQNSTKGLIIKYLDDVEKESKNETEETIEEKNEIIEEENNI